MRIRSNYIDIERKEIYPAEIVIEKNRILSIERIEETQNNFMGPGFIDAHIHIESSMLCPSRFAEAALKHGTIATVSDPHEIANVCGIEGIRFMIEDGKKVPFHFYFGAPSCVPATGFETSGAVIDSNGIKELLKSEDIHYLSEMMNYPGVIQRDEEVLKKIEYAKKIGKKIDGHAPGLRGKKLKKYVEAGISTDHECFSIEEAREKISLGMKVIIREGSAAKNYPALKELIRESPEMLMFCSDDKHPDDLLKGHINSLAARAIADGFDFWNVLQIAAIAAIDHYKLNTGKVRVGDKANFVIFHDIKEFKVSQVFIDGEKVVDNGKVSFKLPEVKPINQFFSYEVHKRDFQCILESNRLRVIEARNGELITKEIVYEVKGPLQNFESDIENDILKLAVVNRYRKEIPSIAWIKNFGLKKGAIASTVAHDSHNIICVGTSDEALAEIVNELMRIKGGIAVYDGERMFSLPLPIAGLMSDRKAEKIGKLYEKLDVLSKELGSKLNAPFMTLSFMALLVIPELKLSDKGLFNGIDFRFAHLNALK